MAPPHHLRRERRRCRPAAPPPAPPAPAEPLVVARGRRGLPGALAPAPARAAAPRPPAAAGAGAARPPSLRGHRRRHAPPRCRRWRAIADAHDGAAGRELRELEQLACWRTRSPGRTARRPPPPPRRRRRPRPPRPPARAAVVLLLLLDGRQPRLAGSAAGDATSARRCPGRDARRVDVGSAASAGGRRPDAAGAGDATAFLRTTSPPTTPPPPSWRRAGATRPAGFAGAFGGRLGFGGVHRLLRLIDAVVCCAVTCGASGLRPARPPWRLDNFLLRHRQVGDRRKRRGEEPRFGAAGARGGRGASSARVPGPARRCFLRPLHGGCGPGRSAPRPGPPRGVERGGERRAEAGRRPPSRS